MISILAAVMPYMPAIVVSVWPSWILTLSFQTKNEHFNKANTSLSNLFLWAFLSVITHHTSASLQSLPVATTIVYCGSIVAFFVLIYLLSPELKEDCFKATKHPKKVSMLKAFLPISPSIMHRELRAIFLRLSLFINIVRSIRKKYVDGIQNSTQPPLDYVKKYSDIVNLFSRLLFLWGILVFLIAKSVQALASENLLFLTYAAPSGLLLLAIAISYSHSVYLFVKISVQHELKIILSERGTPDEEVEHLSQRLEEVIDACVYFIGVLLVFIGGSICLKLIQT